MKRFFTDLIQVYIFFASLMVAIGALGAFLQYIQHVFVMDRRFMVGGDKFGVIEADYVWKGQTERNNYLLFQPHLFYRFAVICGCEKVFASWMCSHFAPNLCIIPGSSASTNIFLPRNHGLAKRRGWR